jgi:predicted nuclease with TOPRIM domain
MLWAALFLVGLYFLTGGSNVFLGEWLIKDSKNRFKEVIQEKERSQKAMGILDEMIRDAKDFNQEAEKAEKKLEKLVKDYRSTRGDFNQLFSEIQEKGERTIAKILDRLPDLKSNILREEWPKAFEERK